MGHTVIAVIGGIAVLVIAIHFLRLLWIDLPDDPGRSSPSEDYRRAVEKLFAKKIEQFSRSLCGRRAAFSNSFENAQPMAGSRSDPAKPDRFAALIAERNTTTS